MKVLHVYNHFYPCIGGIEKYIYDICKKLSELGHQSDVVCLDRCAYSKKKLPNFGEHGKIKIYRLPFLDLKFYKIAPHILKFVRNYDIVHLHGLGFFSDFLVVTKFLHNKPLVLSTHGGVFHTKTAFHFKLLYFYLLERILLRGFKKIIAISRKDKKLFSRINKRTIFIPDGIDYNKYSRIKRKPDKNILIYVGRISRNKRIDKLIEVVYHLKEDIPNIRLYVIGEDWEGLLPNIKKIVKKFKLEKNIVFTGIINEKRLLNFLKKAQFFVSASEYEGFGISVLEAMATGCPVVVNNIDVFKSFIKNKENGFIIDYSNPKEVADLILSMINKDLSNISTEAKKSVKKYDWNNIIKNVEKTYVE